MSAQPTRRLYYGEPEERAWAIVQEAIEEAMEVEDLQHRTYGELAGLHAWAGWYVGQIGWVPRDWTLASPPASRYRHDDPDSPYVQANAPGGVLTLGFHDYYYKLIRAGFVTVEQVDKASDAELLAVKGIARKRLLAIRADVARYHHEQEGAKS
jgi:hypothetical protein